MDLKKVAAKIRPDEKQILKEANSFLDRLNAAIKKSGIRAVAVLGGSIAKGTFLKDDADVDIFVKFDKSYENERLSDFLERCLKGFKAYRIHGSRDYFKIYGKLNFEIVPVYNIKSVDEIVNVTDASIFHVEWVRKEIEKEPRLADEIRLAKAFCKSAGIYGAESYIRGFSGHVLDILIIYYRSFIDLLKDASKWKEKKVIDFYNVHKGKAMETLNPAKTEGPLVLIDPIQADRNAAASLSREKFDIFVKKAREFLKSPSERFFERKKFSIALIKKMAKGKKIIIVKAIPLEGKEDVVGSKLLKCFEYIKNQLTLNEFELIDSGWHWDKMKNALMWFVFPKKLLSKTYEWRGPPLSKRKRVEEFKKKHKKTFSKGKRIFAIVERKYRIPEKLVEDLVKQEYIKEKVSAIKWTVS